MKPINKEAGYDAVEIYNNEIIPKIVVFDDFVYQWKT